MSRIYMWWHRVMLGHRIPSPRISMDAKGAFEVLTCQCGKVWAK